MEKWYLQLLIIQGKHTEILMETDELCKNNPNILNED